MGSLLLIICVNFRQRSVISR